MVTYLKVGNTGKSVLFERTRTSLSVESAWSFPEFALVISALDTRTEKARGQKQNCVTQRLRCRFFDGSPQIGTPTREVSTTKELQTLSPNTWAIGAREGRQTRETAHTGFASDFFGAPRA